MDTTAARLRLVDSDPEKSKLWDGTRRFIGKTDDFAFEIIPDKSVSFFISKVTQEISDILDLYIGDLQKTLDLLKKAAVFCAGNPNTEFRESIGDGLVLTCVKIQASDGGTIHLSICEE